MSTPEPPQPTTLPEPEPQPTVTLPTEPSPEEPTEPPTEQPTEPPTVPPPEDPTDPPTVPPPETTDDPTTNVPPPPPPPPGDSPTSSRTSSKEEPTETAAPTLTSATDPSVTSKTSDSSNSKPSETVITSVITTKNGDTGALTTVVLTSTAAAPTEIISVTGTSTSDGGGSALQTSGSGSDDSGGLSPEGTIAVAVVVPVVSVTLIIIGLIIWWRRREANKRLEQQRKSEIEDYGYNPNNDPTLPTVGGSTFGDGSEMREDNSGYRGWGTTSASRKLSTNLSSGPGMGNTVSENGSNRGYRHGGSPSDGTAQFSDGYGGRISGDSETIGALGMGPAASHNKQNRDIARGPSNASSAGSGGHRSEESEDGTLIDGPGGPGYYEDNPYYNHGQSHHNPYGDGPGQPVIRDVTARRNTRIESPSVIPQQGNSGISQNF